LRHGSILLNGLHIPINNYFLRHLFDFLKKHGKYAESFVESKKMSLF